MVRLDNADGINSADPSLASVNQIGHRAARTAASHAEISPTACWNSAQMTRTSETAIDVG
jgi:hypothetical protein